MAGTCALNLFDRFHIGHQVLLDRIVDMPDPVACVTDGQLLGHDLELAPLIQPLEIRVRRLKEYLKGHAMDQVISVRVASSPEELLEPEGETTFIMYEGPCCTEITSGILDERKSRLGVADTYEFLKPVRANDGGKVSSARIRLGEIDRQGNRLRGTNEPARQLPVDKRTALKSPKGDVYEQRDGSPEERVVKRLTRENPSKVISVGDVTTYTLLQQEYVPDVMIVDGITKRGPFDASFQADETYFIYNPAAVIYPEAWSAIDTAIHAGKTSLVIVDGEEDLMGFPAVLLAPPGSVVLYGQPDVGMVWIPVNDENTRIARELLEVMPVIK